MKNDISNTFRYYIELSKLKIMIPVSLTGFTGYFIFDPGISFNILLITLGILLLAISASALNQIQEADIDSKMERTRHRPIPAKNIKVGHAVLFILSSSISGTVLIFFAGNLKAVLTGLITILWYNVIYTYLKRKTAFAVVPGAVTGALPPLLGWVAAGGGIWDKQIIFFQLLLFTGQIPHFWLLVLKHGGEYEKAGLPSLTNIFNRNQIGRLTFTWVATSVFVALLLCYFKIIRTGLPAGILVAASALLLWRFSDLAGFRNQSNNTDRYSVYLNLYFFLILILLISDRVIGLFPAS